MIACFSSGSGLDGRGSKCSRARPVGIGSSLYLITPTADEEEQVYNQLANLRDSLPIRLRDRVEEVLLGAGANGIAFIDNRRVSVAFEGDVAVYFQGHLTKLDAGAESPAHDILRKYTSGQWAPDASDVNYGGGSLAGEFAFVLFDKLSGRVVAARDQSGTEPLFWGTSAFGEMLLFANDRKMLEARARGGLHHSTTLGVRGAYDTQLAQCSLSSSTRGVFAVSVVPQVTIIDPKVTKDALKSVDKTGN